MRNGKTDILIDRFKCDIKSQPRKASTFVDTLLCNKCWPTFRAKPASTKVDAFLGCDFISHLNPG